MKQIKYMTIIFIVIMSLYSCDSYLDVNNDVNNPPAEVVTPQLILAAAQNGSATALSTTQNQFGNIMMNQWAGDVTNFTGGNDDEYFYNITNTFYDGIWNNQYLVTDKLQAIINKDSEKTTYFTAIAKILKAHNLQYVVDLYGDAPFTEAFQRGDNYQPAYDNAKDIYMALYSSLDDAINLIDNATSAAENPGDLDVMLGGDMDMWKKFANTLKLKLIVRASSSTDADMQSFVTAKISELATATFLGSGDNITNNPGYVADTGKQNPFWNTFGFTTDDNPTQSNKFTVGSEYFIEFLKGSTGNPYDNRISKFFTIASGSATFQGVEQGADDPDDPNIGLSYIGNGLLRSATQDVWFFTASESLFLQSEAALNLGLPGDAKQLFEDGIDASFNLLELGADAATYIAGISTGVPTLEAIITQKWIALHGTDGAEIYIEHLRTGFPNPPLPLLTTDTHRPYRLMYPQSEFVGNSANVINLTRAQVFLPSLFYQQ